jgi:acyl-CoA thioesterase
MKIGEAELANLFPFILALVNLIRLFFISAGLSGKDIEKPRNKGGRVRMEKIKKALAQDRFALETVGVELMEITPGQAKVKMEIRPKHLNGLGTVQGGALFTLADMALASASNSHGTVAVLVNASIAYFKAVSQGVLYAEAREESLKNKLATYTVRVTDGEQELIALMQATVYRKKELL